MADDSGESGSAPSHPAGKQIPRLPDDAIVLHVGLHKTGTTAMQSLLAAARDDLREQGINYPGPGIAHHVAAHALIRWGPRFRHAGDIADTVWRPFARRVARNPGRTVVNSEFLSRANAPAIGNLVTELGRERTYGVIGVRHLAPLSLSAWQQSLKMGNSHDLDEWLARNFFRGEDGRAAGKYFSEQHPSRIVQKWVTALGPDHVFVVVIDPSDRGQLPAVFESLLGLRQGFFAGRAPGMSNRSMTAAETSLVRSVNLALRENVTRDEYIRLIRYGLLRRMIEGRLPAPDEAPLAVPDAVIQLGADEGKQVGQEIEQSGAHVIGDLRNLIEVRRPAAASIDDVSDIPIAAATEAIVGTVAGALRGTWDITAPAPAPAVKPERNVAAPDAIKTKARRGGRKVDELSSADLLRLVVRRVRNRMRRAFGR